MKSQNTYTKDKIHTKQRNKTRAHFRVLTNKENGRKKGETQPHVYTFMEPFSGRLELPRTDSKKQRDPGKTILYFAYY